MSTPRPGTADPPTLRAFCPHLFVPPPQATPAPHHRVCHPLPLPPTSRLTVVLDFDETLAAVYPEPCPSIPVGRSRAAPTLRVSGVDLGEGARGTVRVFVRPGLVEFLEEVSTIADVVLFTAGLPGYAAPIVSALDPAGDRLPVRLYRASTRVVAGTPCVKDLSVLGRDLARVVLVDNSPFSFLAQPECGVPATPFDGCGDDAHLLTTVLPLLRELAEIEDVRPALAARFGMATWLASQAARGGWALYEPPESAEVAAGEVAAVAA